LAAPVPRPPQPIKPMRIFSEPAAWAKFVPSAPAAANADAAAVALSNVRRERESVFAAAFPS
jgi:hypothetical protein